MNLDPNDKRIADFLFEIGTMRKLPRIHRQVLLLEDASDTIASHSYRVTMIGWFLAKLEKVDPYKVVMMCLGHDLSEVRSGDHNWVHKHYVKIFDDEIRKDQLGTLPFSDLEKISQEYAERKSPEAILAKDADLLDQILLLKEYVWQGSKEAELWLGGKKNGKGKDEGNRQFLELKSESAKKIGRAILSGTPSDWWNGAWTNKNR